MIKVTYLDHMGSDLSVVNAARVSFGKTSEMDITDPCGYPKLKGTDEKLIKYLATHKHYSPFGHAFASFHVSMPVFVARQLVKHKFLRWNEISRRYVSDTPEFYHPDVWRGKAADKKQGSEGVVKLEGVDEQIVDAYAAEALTAYQVLLEAGVAPEQARMVLPQSTMTQVIWSGSLDAFADMCNLRCKPDTQLETRLVANQICDKMRELFPVSWLSLRGL
jgi:thymidylate synthase (FAD)